VEYERMEDNIEDLKREMRCVEQDNLVIQESIKDIEEEKEKGVATIASLKIDVGDIDTQIEGLKRVKEEKLVELERLKNHMMQELMDEVESVKNFNQQLLDSNNEVERMRRERKETMDLINKEIQVANEERQYLNNELVRMRDLVETEFCRYRQELEEELQKSLDKRRQEAEGEILKDLSNLLDQKIHLEQEVDELEQQCRVSPEQRAKQLSYQAVEAANGILEDVKRVLSKSSKKNRDILLCSICQDSPSGCKGLPCGHTFCGGSCIEQQIRSSGKCPYCRQVYQVRHIQQLYNIYAEEQEC
jgi:DNA repair exonuclease SbcCD ATPase subunit